MLKFQDNHTMLAAFFEDLILTVYVVKTALKSLETKGVSENLWQRKWQSRDVVK